MLCVAIYLKTCFCVSYKQRIGQALNLEMFSSSLLGEEFYLPAIDARYLVTAELLVNIQEQEEKTQRYFINLSIISFD